MRINNVRDNPSQVFYVTDSIGPYDVAFDNYNEAEEHAKRQTRNSPDGYYVLRPVALVQPEASPKSVVTPVSL